MRKWFFLCLVLACTGLAQAQPRPTGNGDYWLRNEHAWIEWEVLPKELPGRLHTDWPADWQELGAPLPTLWDIWRWPIVIRFPKGLILTAAPDAEGGVITKDENGDNWLRVYSDESTGAICFVRANKRYIKPFKPAQ